jgi:hypothetical protein
MIAEPVDGPAEVVPHANAATAATASNASLRSAMVEPPPDSRAPDLQS